MGLTSLHSENINPYSYSGIKMFPTKMNKSLNEIKNKIYKVCNEKFSSDFLKLIINLYKIMIVMDGTLMMKKNNRN